MEEDLKARLLKPRLAEKTMDLAGIGTIRFRALTRAEVLRLQPLKLAPRERAMVALAMVDPPMSEAEVGAWNKAAPSGEIERVALAIAHLSGLKVGVDKEVYKQFEDDPDSEFRVLSGQEAGDDGGRDEGSDE